jgi:hypothetical protein
LLKREPHFDGAFVDGLDGYGFLAPRSLEPQADVPGGIQSDDDGAEFPAIAAKFVGTALYGLAQNCRHRVSPRCFEIFGEPRLALARAARAA